MEMKIFNRKTKRNYFLFMLNGMGDEISWE